MESTKYLWLGVVEGTTGEKNKESVTASSALSLVQGMWPNFNPTTPTHKHLVLYPVSLASRDQDGGPSGSTIDIYSRTEK